MAAAYIAAGLFVLGGFVFPAGVLLARKLGDRRRGAASDDAQAQARVSLLSVRQGWYAAFSFIFSMQTLALTLVWSAAAFESGYGFGRASELVARKAGLAAATAAVSTFIFLEGVAGLMITYDYLYNKIVQPVIDGHIAKGMERGLAEGEARGRAEGEARGLAEGEARGLAEGEARMRARFVEWLARRAEAERLGVEFTEPMPGADSGVNGHSPQG